MISYRFLIDKQGPASWRIAGIACISSAIAIEAVFVCIAGCGELATSQTSDGGRTDGESSDAAARDGGMPECDRTVVTCISQPPSCPPGDVPSTAGACWSGHCVNVSACASVADCADCVSDRYICVERTRSGFRNLRCVEVPSLCATDRSCSCMQSFVCQFPYRDCTEKSWNELTCHCPFC